MRWKNPLIETERMLTSLSFLALFARDRSRSSASHITHPPHMTVLHSERFQAELGIEVQKFAGSEERKEGKKKP
jgi:hypothetical protein